MRRYVLVVFAGGALAACTLLTPLDGLMEGSPEAGVSPTEAGAADGPADTGTGDVVVDVDAEASVPFCTTVTGAALCADFDDGKAPPAPFDSVALNGVANTLTYDSADSVSRPRSLFITGGPSTSGNTSAGLRWRTPTIASEVTVDFDFKAEQIGEKPFDLVNFVRAGYELSVEIAPTSQLQFDSQIPDGDGGVIDGINKLTANAAATWKHLRWVAKKDVSSRFKVEVFVDDVTVGTTTINQTLFLGQPNVEVGDLALEPSSPPWKVRMDNVVFRVK
ncbi:MAG: hypothetical protein JST00_13185 [Deltaproteobacteria bacterium]|nr:hypothetical protein [Deltaproteobacteria bacterium]